MKKIVITCKLPGGRYEELLADKNFETVVLNDEEHMNLAATLEKLSPDGLISMLSDKIGADVLAKMPDLKVVSNYAVGFNNIDVQYCHEHGITVTNTPGVLTDSTADIAILLMLMTSRRAGESEKYAREGRFKGWAPEFFLGKSLAGKKFGVLGMGRIGFATAKRARAFGLDIIYWSRRRNEAAEKELGAKYLELDEVLRECDFLSLHLPYVPELHHMIDAAKLKTMKKSAIIINTARGQLIDEAALTGALEKKEIYAAGFDVYEFEPKINEKLMTLENVALLPHIGSATEETRSEMARMVIDDCTAVLRGEKAQNIV
ncbi:D-glycerate dehydrogenase [bacterium]|nr:D-glycerate dehydrogenase [bacterium]